MNKKPALILKAALVFLILLLLSGCAQPENNASKIDSPRKFNTELFLYPEAEVRNVLETTDTAGKKMVVFLSTDSTTAAVLNFYRIKAVQSGLRIAEERETARGYLLTVFNRDKRAATIAIYSKDGGSDVVIEYYPALIPESGQ